MFRQIPDSKTPRVISLPCSRRPVHDDLSLGFYSLVKFVVDVFDVIVVRFGSGFAGHDLFEYWWFYLGDSEKGPALLRRDLLLVRSIPVHPQGMIVFFKFLSILVAFLVDRSYGKNVRNPPVRNNDVPGLEFHQSPQFVGLLARFTFRAVFKGIGKRLLEVGFVFKLCQVANVLPT